MGNNSENKKQNEKQNLQKRVRRALKEQEPKDSDKNVLNTTKTLSRLQDIYRALHRRAMLV